MDWKRKGKQLLFPPIWLMIVFVIFSTAALIWVFSNEMTENPVAYVIYVMSFYTLTVVCVRLHHILPDCYKKIKEKIYKNKFGNRYMTDVQFKNHVSLYCSLSINILYIGTNAFSAYFYHTAWFGIFTVYYAIMAVMRFLLVRYINRNKLGEKRLLELKRARLCAMILTTLNLILSGAVLMILFQNRGFDYHGILIYVMAMYTFYETISAGIDLMKYRKYNNPILSTTKVIKMASALVSVLSLETAMFSQFGEDMTLENQKLMIILTGAGISVIVVTMAMYMIVQTTKEIKRLKYLREAIEEN